MKADRTYMERGVRRMFMDSTPDDRVPPGCRREVDVVSPDRSVGRIGSGAPAQAGPNSVISLKSHSFPVEAKGKTEWQRIEGVCSYVSESSNKGAVARLKRAQTTMTALAQERS